MTREEAIQRIETHTQYFVPVEDLPALEMAIDALRAQQEAEKNEPLTLDELREMDGEPVWVVCLTDTDLSCWGFHDEDGVCGYCANFSDDDYGKTWLAYRRKPKGEQE